MIEVRRGDLIIGAAKGDFFGSPRPCVVVQADRYPELDSVLVCPTTTDLGTPRPMRVRSPPTRSGLKKLSDVMVDKMLPMSRAKIGQVVGRLPPAQMRSVEACLMAVLDLTLPKPTKKKRR